MDSYYSEEEVRQLGFAHVGSDVRLSRKASIYGCGQMVLHDHIRIDDFCILSGKIVIGSYVHIAAYTALYGSTDGIYVDDFANISARICIYATSDDYSGASMTNPLIPDAYKHVAHAAVHIGRSAIIGSNCTVLPGADIGEGAAVGAMSLVKRSLEPWGIYAGIPCRRIKERKKEVRSFEEAFLRGEGPG